MIVGIYDNASGAAVVLPLEKASEQTGYSAYLLKQAMEGKSRIAGKTVVRLPNNATWRWPESAKHKKGEM